MQVPKIYDSEYRFMRLLWIHAPVRSGMIVRICKDELGWAPTTTYTVMKRLGERNVIKNEHALVTPLISREECQIALSHDLVEKRFGGSLPAFVAAFCKGRKMSEEELNSLQAVIEQFREEA